MAACALVASSSAALANSAEFRHLTIPAASCVPSGTPAQNALGKWTVGSWDLSRNGTFKLTCALPVATGSLTDFRISYRDPDGRTGNASVKALLVRAKVPPLYGPGNTTYLDCDFLSNKQGTTTGSFTHQVVACPHPIEADAFYFFEIELWRRAAAGDAGNYVAFVGLDFP
ncbi:MAG: hypothetical protein AB7I59_11150 [Geminicoccaceae bacterium]